MPSEPRLQPPPGLPRAIAQQTTAPRHRSQPKDTHHERPHAACTSKRRSGKGLQGTYIIRLQQQKRHRSNSNRPPGSVPYTYPCAGKQEQDRTALCTVHGREIRYARAPSLVLKPLADSLGLHGFSSSAPRVLHGSTNSEPYISLCTWRSSQCTIRPEEKVNRFLVFSPQKATPSALTTESTL